MVFGFVLVGPLAFGGLMTGLHLDVAGFAGVIVASDPWHRVGGFLTAGRDGPGERIQGISFECSTMSREALRRNESWGSGDSDAIRLAGLLTLW
jgi:hypothetical protein